MPRSIWIIALVITALFALVRVFPLSWVAKGLPDSPATFSGTFWDGQVRNIPLFGQLSVKGHWKGATIETMPGETTLKASVFPNRVEELVLSLPMAKLPAPDPRIRQLDGRVSLRLDRMTFSDTACLSARGTASTDVLAANRAQFQWAGPTLSGPVDCVDGRMRAQLSGADDGQSVQVIFTTGIDGAYETLITVETVAPEAANVLGLFGFSQNEAGQFTLNEQGRWR